VNFEHSNTVNELQTVIKIKGLSCPTTILHITDSHINATDATEGEEAWAGAYAGHHFDEIAARSHFETALAYAKERSVDGVVLTGDIVNGATVGNLDYLGHRLGQLPMPLLYTPGNHDWEMFGEPWGEETRRKHVGKFARIAGGDPSFSVRQLNGILIIGVDNSTYQISPDQLQKFHAELERRLPVLLFMHIPLYVPSLLKDVLQMWGSPIMMNAEGWDDRSLERWRIQSATDKTREFHRLLLDNPKGNLVGVFCGHVHFPHSDAFGLGSRQYVTKPGFQGGYRMIRLVPGK
jgi:predicted phosphodiesterase